MTPGRVPPLKLSGLSRGTPDLEERLHGRFWLLYCYLAPTEELPEGPRPPANPGKDGDV